MLYVPQEPAWTFTGSCANWVDARFVKAARTWTWIKFPSWTWSLLTDFQKTEAEQGDNAFYVAMTMASSVQSASSLVACFLTSQTREM